MVQDAVEPESEVGFGEREWFRREETPGRRRVLTRKILAARFKWPGGRISVCETGRLASGEGRRHEGIRGVS
jgi:hypothetical protein